MLLSHPSLDRTKPLSLTVEKRPPRTYDTEISGLNLYISKAKVNARKEGYKAILNAKISDRWRHERISNMIKINDYASHIIIRRVVLLSGNLRPGPREDGVDVRAAPKACCSHSVLPLNS